MSSPCKADVSIAAMVAIKKMQIDFVASDEKAIFVKNEG